jgi:hypothetical protein
MGHTPSRFLVGVVTVAYALVGCSSGGSGGDDARKRPERSAERTPSTTAPSTRIDLSKPIPGGSLHGTPRPPLENTGDDYVAIFESLDAQIRWLGENPDPALIPEVYAPGTEDHDLGLTNFHFLASNGYRWADEGYQLLSVQVIDVRPEAVSIRFSDSMEFERIVDTEGNQVGEIRPRSPKVKNWSALLAHDAEGRWRLADVAPEGEGTVEV